MIKIIGGDHPKQNATLRWGTLILKNKQHVYIKYLLRSAIQDLEKISDGWFNTTYKITMKDGNNILCKSNRKEYTKIYMENEEHAKEGDYVSKEVMLYRTQRVLKALGLAAFLAFLFILLASSPEKTNNTKPHAANSDRSLPAVKTASVNAVPEKLPSQTVINPANKIAEYAVQSITKSGYPTTYKTWGANKIKHINDLQPKAALKIAASPECNRLEMLGLSLDRSIPPNKIVFFADCANGQRFYITESEIKASGAVRSKSAKLSEITDTEAQTACIKQTQAMLNFPSSFDLKVLSLDISRATTGNIEVTFNFDAKNGLGNVLPQKARCIIDDVGLHPVEISNR